MVPYSHKSNDATGSLETALKTALDRHEVISAQISKLQQTREELDAEIALHRSKLSPWHLLSDDIIGEIFECCLLDYPGQRAPMSITVAPMVLTLVSHQWRAVALSTSSLWASVHFVLPSMLIQGTQAEQQYLARLDALRAWLLRSGSVPIAISFTKLFMFRELSPRWAYDSEDKGNRAFRAIFPVIYQFANRLRAVNLPSIEYRDNLRQARGLNLEFPILEHLKDQYSGVAAYWPNSLKAPHMRRLSVFLSNLKDMANPWTQCSWSQLTDLEISDPCSPQTLLGILSLCPKLRLLSISCKEDDPDWPGSTNRIESLLQTHCQQSGGSGNVTLLYLHTCKLIGSGIHQLLENLHMPNLKDVKSHESIHRTDQLNTVTGELNWRGFLLSTLQAGNIDIFRLSLLIQSRIRSVHIVDSLVRLLRAQHGLKKLHINVLSTENGGVDFMARFLEGFLEDMSDPAVSILPMLEELELTGVSDESIDTALDFLQAVTRSSKIREVRVVIPRLKIEWARENANVRGNPIQHGNLSKETLVKMKQFLDSPDTVGGQIFVVITGSPPPLAAFPGYQNMDPFHGMETADPLYSRHETSLHDLFKEDIMLSWLALDENDSDAEDTSESVYLGTE
jgi:hypothetical protein